MISSSANIHYGRALITPRTWPSSPETTTSPASDGRTTYSDLARQFGVTLEQINWRDRRVTKPGLRNFLKAVAAVKFDGADHPRWQQLYEQSIWAQEVAFTQLHVRLPKRYSLDDRARVKYLMTKEWVEPDMIRKVTRWTEGE